MLNKYYFCFLMSCLFFMACQFNPNYQGRGSELIQGVWEEIPVPYKDSLIQYTRHTFRFTCDSVYINLITQAKANYYPDSCFNNGRWNEYAKGNYVIKNDTLFILATFTKTNFKQKLSGCYRIGQYLPRFVIKKKTATQIEMKGLEQHIPIILELKEKIVCNPQPL